MVSWKFTVFSTLPARFLLLSTKSLIHLLLIFLSLIYFLTTRKLSEFLDVSDEQGINVKIMEPKGKSTSYQWLKDVEEIFFNIDRVFIKLEAPKI